MIRVYAVRWSDVRADEALSDRLYRAATADRRKKADRYNRREDAVQCLTADGLLRYALRAAGAAPSVWAAPPVIVGAHGKPSVEGAPNFHYNLSHGGDWVVLAWDRCPVGVDVERMDPQRAADAMARRYFSEAEQAYVQGGETEKLARFYALWTGKESYLKYRGTGFACGMVTPDLSKDGLVIHGDRPVFLRRMKLAGDHLLAVCGERNEVDVAWLSAKDLLIP